MRAILCLAVLSWSCGEVRIETSGTDKREAVIGEKPPCEDDCDEPNCVSDDGAVFSPGQQWVGGWGDCTCTADGSWDCPSFAPPIECEYDGRTYFTGDTFPTLDACNLCTCKDDGTTSCSEMACATGCVVDDQYYFDDEWVPRDASCCTCLGGTVVCADGPCNPSCSVESGPTNSAWSFSATDFLYSDGACAATCQCSVGGGVVCTWPESCDCDPAQEPWRQYWTGDPNADFDCPSTLRPFNNDCGVGCEQDPNCPAVLDCTMAPTEHHPCDALAAVAERCPFTQITSEE